jgi:ribonuclease P protein component
MLPKKNRITKASEYDKIRKEGKSIRTPYFIFNYRLNAESKEPRFGFIASKKVGGAVERNRAKRLLREAVRAKLDAFPGNIEVTIVVFDKVVDQKLEVIQKEMEKVIERLKN